MSNRKIVAYTVLAVWVAALAWQASRLYLRPETERLAEAARTLPPGVAYYAVHQGGRHAGWAQSEIDTLPSGAGFLVDDRIQMDLGGLGMAGRAEVRSHARLGPALGLQEFTVEAVGLLEGLSARGRVAGDSVLHLVVARGGDTTRRTIPTEGPVVLGTSLPLRIAAEGGAEAGDRFEVPTFDPVTMEMRRGTVEILERKVRTYPDSAVLDDRTGDWREARRDTVLAWRIRREMAGVELEAWVDEDGRYLELGTPLGFRLERTAFELAYYGSRVGSGRDEAEGVRP
jgi:hypothetical protein